MAIQSTGAPCRFASSTRWTRAVGAKPNSPPSVAAQSDVLTPNLRLLLQKGFAFSLSHVMKDKDIPAHVFCL
jgi:hypothetical protein